MVDEVVNCIASKGDAQENSIPPDIDSDTSSGEGSASDDERTTASGRHNGNHDETDSDGFIDVEDDLSARAPKKLKKKTAKKTAQKRTKKSKKRNHSDDSSIDIPDSEWGIRLSCQREYHGIFRVLNKI